jgi:hypothetical protein
MNVFPPTLSSKFCEIFLKDLFQKQKYQIYQNLTSYSVTYLKIVLLTLLILRKFSKITSIFF